MKKRILYSILNEWRDEDIEDFPLDLDDMDFEPTSSDMNNEPDLDDDEFILSTTNKQHTQGFNEYMGGMYISKVDGWFFNPYYIKEPIFKAKDLKDAEKIVNDYFQRILKKLNDKNLQNNAKIITQTLPKNFNSIISTKDIANLLEIPENYITKYTINGITMDFKVNFEKLMYANTPTNIHHNNKNEFDIWYNHYFRHYAFLTQEDMPDKYFTNIGSLNKTIFKWSFLKDLNTNKLLSRHIYTGWEKIKTQPVQVVSSPNNLCMNLSRYRNDRFSNPIFYVPISIPEINLQMIYIGDTLYEENILKLIIKTDSTGFSCKTFSYTPKINDSSDYKIYEFSSDNFIEEPTFSISTLKNNTSKAGREYNKEQSKIIKHALQRTIPYYNFKFKPSEDDLKLYKNLIR